MTGKMPTTTRYAPEYLRQHMEEMHRAQSQAAMNMRRDPFGVYSPSALYNAWPPAQGPKWRTNAIGIPLIKYTGRFDEL